MAALVGTPIAVVWGLFVLLLIAGVTIMQVPGLGPTHGPVPKAATSLTPRVSSAHACSQFTVSGRGFTGADLRGARLAHLDLRGRNFQRADGADTEFEGRLLNGINFAHADLRGANPRDICLRGAGLTGTQLANADFTGADVTDVAVTPGVASQAIGWGQFQMRKFAPGANYRSRPCLATEAQGRSCRGPRAIPGVLECPYPLATPRSRHSGHSAACVPRRF